MQTERNDFVNYTENSASNRKKFNAGLYIIIAVCLLALGIAAWFALSRAQDQTPTEKMPQGSEYNSGTSSYNESILTPPVLPNESVAQSASEVPYSSEDTVEEKQNYFTMPLQGKILKDFSLEVLQYDETYGDMRLHTGIDIEAKENSQVCSAANGKVLAIENNNFGCGVVIKHTEKITVKYYSLCDLKVKVGDSVKMGDVIGLVSAIPAECVAPSHIHIEVLKDDVPVNPLEALGLN